VINLQPSPRRLSGDAYHPRQGQSAVERLRGTASGLPPAPAAGRTNSAAVAALVCGILAFCGLGPIAIVAVILGHKALRQIGRSGQEGHGLAKTGLVLGYLALAFGVLGLLFIFGFSRASSPTMP
jgi:hypothetical protein